MTAGAPRSSEGDRFALYDLFAAYGALIDAGEFDAWLALFAATCTYHIVPRENYDRGLPAGLVYCDSRAMLEDRIRALREANKYNIHADRHLICLPRLIGEAGDATPPDFAAQCEHAMDNVEALLATADMNTADLVKLTYYATRAIDFPILVQIRQRRWALDPAPSVTAIAVVAVARPEYLIEIEAMAVTPA